MEVHQAIQSAHLFNLLRFEEEKHRVPIIYGKRPNTCAIGAFIIPEANGDYDKPISIPLDEDEIVVGYVDVDQVVLAHDVDAILSGEKEPPKEINGLSKGGFVSRVVDAVVKVAVELYQTSTLERVHGEYIQNRIKNIRYRLSELRERSRRCSDEIYSLERKLGDQWRLKQKTEEEIQALEHFTVPQLRKKAEEECKRLWGLVPAKFRSIQLREWAVRIETQPIRITYDGFDFEMGRFGMTLPFSPDGKILIDALDRPSPHPEFPHSHVSTEGYPCWGNLAGGVAECRASGDLFHLAVLAHSLLTSYNPQNPYEPLERWDPNWQEEDRYEPCLNDADPYLDCVQCEDEGCPYWVDRHEMCAQNLGKERIDLERCTACALCENHYDALELLAELNDEEDN